jgi:hypothetical protein
MKDKDTQFVEHFQVLGLDGKNPQICFIVPESPSSTKPCWCRANRRMKVGMVVKGRLIPQSGSDNLPKLLIEN